MEYITLNLGILLFVTDRQTPKQGPITDRLVTATGYDVTYSSAPVSKEKSLKYHVYVVFFFRNQLNPPIPYGTDIK